MKSAALNYSLHSNFYRHFSPKSQTAYTHSCLQPYRPLPGLHIQLVIVSFCCYENHRVKIQRRTSDLTIQPTFGEVAKDGLALRQSCVLQNVMLFNWTMAIPKLCHSTEQGKFYLTRRFNWTLTMIYRRPSLLQLRTLSHQSATPFWNALSRSTQDSDAKSGSCKLTPIVWLKVFPIDSPNTPPNIHLHCQWNTTKPKTILYLVDQQCLQQNIQRATYSLRSNLQMKKK